METEPFLYCEAFDPDRHLPDVRQWRSLRGLNMPDASWFPATSWVCIRQDDETHEPLPVGFLSLYMDANVGICHLDWLTTRPHLTPNMAHLVAEELLRCAERCAKSVYQGPFVMIGSVQSEAMAKQAQKRGFTPSEQVYQIVKGVELWPQPHSQSSQSSPPQ